MKKENAPISYATGLYFEVPKDRYRAAISAPKTSTKKQFKKALARKLGVKYRAIKKMLPDCLNSTLIANQLDASIAHFTHEEIRNISQKLKLEFDEFP